jgi:hypothetical protein
VCGSTTMGYLDYTGLLAGIIDPHVDLGTCVATLKHILWETFEKCRRYYTFWFWLLTASTSLGFSLFANLGNLVMQGSLSLVQAKSARAPAGVVDKVFGGFIESLHCNISLPSPNH